MPKRECLLFPLFCGWNGICRLDVHLLWSAIDHKVDFVLPCLVRAVLSARKHYHAYIDRVSTSDQLTVDDVFHQVCRFRLAEIDACISEAWIGV